MSNATARLIGPTRHAAARPDVRPKLSQQQAAVHHHNRELTHFVAVASRCLVVGAFHCRRSGDRILVTLRQEAAALVDIVERSEGGAISRSGASTSTSTSRRSTAGGGDHRGQ